MILFPRVTSPGLRNKGIRVVIVAPDLQQAIPHSLLETFPRAQGLVLWTKSGDGEVPEGWLSYPLDTPLKIEGVFDLAIIEQSKLTKEELFAAERLLWHRLHLGAFFINGDAPERRHFAEIRFNGTVIRLPRQLKKLVPSKGTWPSEREWEKILGQAFAQVKRANQREALAKVVKPYNFTPDGFGRAAFKRAAAWTSEVINGAEIVQRPPLLQPSPAAMAAILASGGLGTFTLRDGDETIVLRGRTAREFRTDTNTTVTGAGEEVITVSRQADFSSEVMVLDPSKPTATTLKVGGQDFADFLERWGKKMAAHLEKHLPATYHPDKTPFWETFLPHLSRAITAPFGDGYLQPLPGHKWPHLSDAQAHIVAATTLALLGERALRPDKRQGKLPKKGFKAALLLGQPGSGKTAMLAAAFRTLARDYAWRYGKTFNDPGWPLFAWVSPPGNLEHVKATMVDVAPEFLTVEVRNAGDVYRAVQRAKHVARPVMLLIPRTALREKAEDVPKVVVRADRVLCPTCGSLVGTMQHKDNGVELPDLPTLCPVCHHALQGYERSDFTEQKALRDLWFRIDFSAVRRREASESEMEKWRTYQTLRSKQWQAQGTGVGVPTALKDALNKHRLMLYALGVDEAHEDKARASQQAEGMGMLASQAHRVIAMTGTFGGTAEDIFYLIRRLFPSAFPRGGNSPLASARAFLQTYGRYLETWRTMEDGSGKKRLQPLPGVSPLVSSAVILPRSVPVQLSDVAEVLPPRREILLPVTLSAAEQEAYTSMAKTVMGTVYLQGPDRTISASAAPAVLLRVAPSAWHHPLFALWSPALKCPICGQPLSQCNHRFLGDPLLKDALAATRLKERLIFPGEDDETATAEGDAAMAGMADGEQSDPLPDVVEPVLDEDFVSSKEEVLIRFVQAERSEGRKVIVFVSNSGRFALGKRLADVLRKHGVRTVDVTGVASDKILSKMRRGRNADAFILGMNGATGLNLNEFASTVVLYQPTYAALQAVQATYRIDRASNELGQEIRVAYMYALGTGEEAVLARMISKMVAILLLGGADPTGVGLLAQEVGHELSPWEEMVNVVTGRTNPELERAMDGLAKAWRQVRSPSGLFPPVPDEIWEAARKGVEREQQQETGAPVYAARKTLFSARETRGGHKTLLTAPSFPLPAHRAAVVRPSVQATQASLPFDAVPGNDEPQPRSRISPRILRTESKPKQGNLFAALNTGEE